MARLWQSGFELNSTTAGVEWTNVTNGTIQTSTVRTGTHAGQITSLVSATARYFSYQYATGTPANAYFLRTYINVATLPSADNTIMQTSTSSAPGGAAAPSIRLSSTGTFKLFTGNSQIGSASASITTNTWHRLELKFKAGTGSAIVEGSLDGTIFATSSAQNASGEIYLFLGGNLSVEAQTTGNWFFDDIAINDDTGTAQTGYPGSGNILHLTPNGAGDTTQWTIGGSSPAATNWQSVNEIPPDDAVTDVQVKVLNNTDNYALTDTPATIGSSDTINVVQVGIRYSGASSLNSTVKIQLESQASGIKQQSATISPTSVTWVTNTNAAPANYPLTSYTDPQGGGSWTKALLDTAQIGGTCTTAGSNRYNLTNIWASVDYTAASGPGPVNVSDTTTTSESVTVAIQGVPIQAFTTVIANKFVGPMALRQNFRQPYTPQYAPVAQFPIGYSAGTFAGAYFAQGYFADAKGQLDVPDLEVKVSDTTTTSESISLTEVSLINLSDTTVTSESVTVQITTAINVSDTTTTSENITVVALPPDLAITVQASNPNYFINGVKVWS